MPAVHESYPCHVCAKTHALYFAAGAVPDLHKQFFYICPANGFAVRITRASGWKPVEAQPPDTLPVHCGEGVGRDGA
jgi:hypothetical protein